MSKEDKKLTALATIGEKSVDAYVDPNPPFAPCCDDVAEECNSAIDNTRRNIMLKRSHEKPPRYSKEVYGEFFKQFSKYGNLRDACTQSGLPRGYVKRHSKKCPEFQARMKEGAEQSKERIDLRMRQLALGEAKKIEKGFEQSIPVLIELSKVLNPDLYNNKLSQDNRTQVNINLNEIIKEAEKIWDAN